MKTKLMIQGALAALLGASAIAVTATPASAYVACNRSGDCWRTTERYNYHPGWGIRIHDDNWKWRGSHYRWRNHEGRGYWRNGLWITF